MGEAVRGLAGAPCLTTARPARLPGFPPPFSPILPPPLYNFALTPPPLFRSSTCIAPCATGDAPDGQWVLCGDDRTDSANPGPRHGGRQPGQRTNPRLPGRAGVFPLRSEEHTSELQ